MRALVVVHVREGGRGEAVATPVPFVELAQQASNAELAVAGAVPVVAERLRALEPVDRLPFAEAPKAELMRVPVEVVPGGGGEPLEVAVAVVLLQRVAQGESWLVAHVPVLPGFELAARSGDRERLVSRVASRLRERLGSWSATSVLNADEPEGSRLQVIEVELGSGGEAGEEEEEEEESVLAEFGVDVTGRTEGRIDGRDELVQRVLETLAGQERSSVLLVGSRGVGKTALVHELARRITLGEAPPALVGRRVWRLTANELIAGAQYTGQWQGRVRRLVGEARRTRAIIDMGDPVALVEVGRWSRSDNNVSRYLRPYVERGELTLICECSVEQLAAARRQEPSFVAAFQRVDVVEPSREQARAIAVTAAARLAEAGRLTIELDAVEAAIELTARFEPYSSFPGKALRLLEDAVREREDGGGSLDQDGVTAAFARRSGMPLALLSDSVPLKMASVRSFFEERVLGQEEALATMVDLVAVLKAGLNDPQKPLASFFFVGPTGVGKTELAKAVAELLFGSRDRLVRFDMGEYAPADAVQRLIGTTWGSSEGALTRLVREQPFCVVLLDEIEKAHWSVFDALLAAIGEGRLSDAAGRTADFRNAIVIMTSNLGASRVGSAPLGFGAETSVAEADRRYVEEAEKFFRPEFFNRLDKVVAFRSLNALTVRRIARRELERLLEREGMRRRQPLVEVDGAVVDCVAANGFHPRYGARPLQRAIERLVAQPLARLLVQRRPKPGSLLRFQVADGEVVVKVEQVEEQQTRIARRERRAISDDATLGKSERAAADFAEQLSSDVATALADDLRATVSELVGATHGTDFWDDATRARETLQQIYRLEHVLDRFDALRERAEGLTHLARRVRETQHRTRSAELRRALSEMEDQLVVLRLELAAAAAGGTTAEVTISVIPIGDATTWATRLRRMYTAWAERTARDATTDEERQQLTISGPATHELLAGEAGIHRRVAPEATEQLARVFIHNPDAPADEDAPTAVVRVYEEGRRRVVRDPRTGARVTNVAAVLHEGRIDPFLIAALRRRRDPLHVPRRQGAER
jgi:ATP-dependent Clp protease ATP-binding subunit ClpA